jgi:hypothetical protein
MANPKKIHINIPWVNTPSTMHTILMDIATEYLTMRDLRSSSGLRFKEVALWRLLKCCRSFRIGNY